MKGNELWFFDPLEKDMYRLEDLKRLVIRGLQDVTRSI